MTTDEKKVLYFLNLRFSLDVAFINKRSVVSELRFLQKIYCLSMYILYSEIICKVRYNTRKYSLHMNKQQLVQEQTFDTSFRYLALICEQYMYL